MDAGGPIQPSLISLDPPRYDHDAAHARTSAELMEAMTGREVDAPLCLTCGTKMRPSGSCYVCEGCGATSGCS